MLKVPRRLNRNAKGVQKRGNPADTGLELIKYMCEVIGLEDLGESDVLDLGCGSRFTQTFINRHAPVRSYTGLETHRPTVRFLQRRVNDPRFTYRHVDTRNILYNPNGRSTDLSKRSPLHGQSYDVACMFSVITHQQPDESSDIFEFLRRHVRKDGHLFFSAFIHDDEEPFRELDPERPGMRASYSLTHMRSLVESARWSIVSIQDPHPNGLPITTSFLCRPAHVSLTATGSAESPTLQGPPT